MPMKWVEPDVAYTHVDENDDPIFCVFHVYKDNDLDNPQTYHFRLDPGEQDEDFDIRDWPGYDPSKCPEENLAAACQAGDIISLMDDDPEGFCGLQPRQRRKATITLEVTYTTPKGFGSCDDMAYLIDASVRHSIGRGLLTEGQDDLEVDDYTLSVDVQ